MMVILHDDIYYICPELCRYHISPQLYVCRGYFHATLSDGSWEFLFFWKFSSHRYLCETKKFQIIYFLKRTTIAIRVEILSKSCTFSRRVVTSSIVGFFCDKICRSISLCILLLIYLAVEYVVFAGVLMHCLERLYIVWMRNLYSGRWFVCIYCSLNIRFLCI